MHPRDGWVGMAHFKGVVRHLAWHASLFRMAHQDERMRRPAQAHRAGVNGVDDGRRASAAGRRGRVQPRTMHGSRPLFDWHKVQSPHAMAGDPRCSVAPFAERHPRRPRALWPVPRWKWNTESPYRTGKTSETSPKSLHSSQNLQAYARPVSTLGGEAWPRVSCRPSSRAAAARVPQGRP